MTVLDAIKDRYSVRSYLSKPVGEEDMKAILEAAQFAQSAKNLQDWRFVVVRDESMRKLLVEAANGQAFVGEAPVVIVCCGINIDYVMGCGQNSYTIDVSIAMENMALVAHELGLGTCWLGSFSENQVKKLLNIPMNGVRIVGILTIGYPADKSRGKKRYPLDKIVYDEKWQTN